MTGGEKRETRIIRCPACKRYYRIAAGPPAPGTRLRCSKCGEVFSLAGAAAEAAASAPARAAARGPATPAASAVTAATTPASAPAPERARGRVLIATDGEEFHSLIGEVLSAAGFELRAALSGDEAWESIGAWKPHVALLDVALPGVPAFELCDRVRADRAVHGTGLILIASVFQQTRYKRAPTSLYGADDYIEKHHIRDWLVEKVARLLPAAAAPAAPAAAAAPAPEAAPAKAASGAAAAPAPAPAPRTAPAAAAPHGGSDEREQESLIREELYGSQGGGRQGLERLRESLKRYARIIISDIALYNQELVDQGIREGTFSELLKKEIDEGHRLYLTRVPPSAGGVDHYHEAVRDFVAKRTAAGGPRPPRRPGGP